MDIPVHWLSSRLYRNRRRFAIVPFFSFIGGWLAFWKDPAILFGFPIALVAGAAFALGVTAFLGVLILLFPSIRSQAEAVSFSLPILSLMGNFDPGVDSFTLQLLSVTGLTVIFLIVNLYAGTWLDRFLPRRNAIYRSVVRSSLSPEELWPHVCVTPDSAAEFRSENSLALEWIEPGKVYREVERTGDIAKVEEVGTILANEPPTRYRFAFEATDAANVPGCRGVIERRLTRTANGSQLETARHLDLTSWRAALFLWVDDGYARLDEKSVRSFEAKEAVWRMSGQKQRR